MPVKAFSGQPPGDSKLSKLERELHEQWADRDHADDGAQDDDQRRRGRAVAVPLKRNPDTGQPDWSGYH
jgi:hypothetical protein